MPRKIRIFGYVYVSSFLIKKLDELGWTIELNGDLHIQFHQVII